jgi:hypothetical protein
MDSYVIRIYRKKEDNPRHLIGIVEKVGIGERKVFSNLNELWSILNPGKRSADRADSQKPRKRKPKVNGVPRRI